MIGRDQLCLSCHLGSSKGLRWPSREREGGGAPEVGHTCVELLHLRWQVGFGVWALSWRLKGGIRRKGKHSLCHQGAPGMRGEKPLRSVGSQFDGDNQMHRKTHGRGQRQRRKKPWLPYFKPSSGLPSCFP